MQCMTWLGGVSLSVVEEGMVIDAEFDRQQWIVSVMEELRHASIPAGELPWDRLSIGLNACIESAGRISRLGRMTGIQPNLISEWRNRRCVPSFNNLIEFCHALSLSPLQLISEDQTVLRRSVKASEENRQIHTKHRKPRTTRDDERALKLIQAVLEGREPPLSLRQIGLILGLSSQTLVYRFPRESTLIHAQYQAYLAERARRRVEKVCAEVRQVTLALQQQGIFPSARRVTGMLSNPNFMMAQEARDTWHAVRHELGLEE